MKTTQAAHFHRDNPRSIQPWRNGCARLVALSLVGLLAAVTTAPALELYVADNNAQRIYKYTPPNLDGIFTTAVNFPRGLAFDAAGNLYVADNGSGNVLKFAPDGRRSVFASGFVGVSDLAFDANGNLFASDAGTGAADGLIAKITPAGDKTTFASGLTLPRGLAFDGSGDLYLAEQGSSASDSAILKFTPDGTQSTFTDVGHNHHLQGIAFDPTGDSAGRFLYVVDDVPTPVIMKFDTTGASETTFTTNVNDPADLAFDSSGNLYVTDTGFGNGSGVVYVFAPDGTRATLSSGLSSPLGIAVAPATSTPSPTPSPTPTATATPGSSPAQLLNISTRMEVLTGNNVLIGGFIITGSDAKKVAIRGLGPSLPVSQSLADPLVELHDSSGNAFPIAGNDNWKSDDNTGQSQEAAVRATGIAPSNDLESFLLITLPANNAAYTAIVSGNNNNTGIGQVEIYDLDQAAYSQLANISTRGFVDVGENVMIGGFISGNGNGSSRIIVRGIGPSLAINGALQDPFLEIHDSNGGLLQSNNDWQEDQNASQVQAAGIAPKDPRESAIYMVLPPAAYTAIVKGVQNSTGIGLVEVYNLQ